MATIKHKIKRGEVSIKNPNCSKLRGLSNSSNEFVSLQAQGLEL